MVEFDRHLAVANLGIVKDLRHVVDLAHTHVGLGQQVVPLVAGFGHQHGLEFLAYLLVPLGRGLREVAGLHAAVFPVRAVQRVTQVVPQPGLGTADAELLVVFGIVHAVVGKPAAKNALAPAGHGPVGKIVAHIGRSRQQGDGGVEVGHVDQLALAGAFPSEQREHDAGHAVHGRSGVVGDDIERNGRRPFGLTDQVEHAAESQIVQVVGRVVPVRSVLAKAAQRAVHQARVEFAERVVIAAQAPHHPGPKALDQHVMVFGQVLQDGLSGGFLEVEGDAFFVAVGEIGGQLLGLIGGRRGARAGQLARRRRLDLEHLGAHVRQHHGAERPRSHPGQLQDFDSV